MTVNSRDGRPSGACVSDLEATASATLARRRSAAKMLVLARGSGESHHQSLDHLTDWLTEGDVLVMNDAATLPTSLMGKVAGTGEQIEVRLLENLNESVGDLRRWRAVVFGAGDWRTPTEQRNVSQTLSRRCRLEFADELAADVVAVACGGSLVELRFLQTGIELWKGIYTVGRPIQYSYHTQPLALWDIQTAFASRPVALEAPSAGFHLKWGDIRSLEEKGVKIVSVTHATGLSSLGRKALDALLPLPERFHISAKSAAQLNQATRSGRRIIAVGTGATRAIESAALLHAASQLREAAGSTDLIITKMHRLRIVNGILTGMHTEGTSHLELLSSFIDLTILKQKYDEARMRGYLWHEYGDLCLIL